MKVTIYSPSCCSNPVIIIFLECKIMYFKAYVYCLYAYSARLDPIDFHCMDKKKKILFCKISSFIFHRITKVLMFVMTWGWVNNDKMIYFQTIRRPVLHEMPVCYFPLIWSVFQMGHCHWCSHFTACLHHTCTFLCFDDKLSCANS